MYNMKRMKMFFIILGAIPSTCSFAQNNAIFKGGVADGWMSKNYIQTSTSIYKGGNADGYVSLNSIQLSTNIFKGGFSDGWSSLNYIQGTTNIFKGGFSDGWDSKNYLQASTIITKGGQGDGWSLNNYVQNSLVIQKGGTGDGWASTYRPQGPLPITLISFNAQKLNATAAVLNWTTSQEFNSSYFDVERSNDAINFNYLGRVAAAGNSSSPLQYSFTDLMPLMGMDYYRLKEVDLDGRSVYTPARLLRFEGNGESIKYYPNPTKGILTIVLPVQAVTEPMVINISNVSGIVVEQIKMTTNGNSNVTLNMNRFARGTYFIQVKTSTMNSTQRVVLQ